MVLMFSVIYKGKAIPIVWSVHKAKKGHLPQTEMSFWNFSEQKKVPRQPNKLEVW